MVRLSLYTQQLIDNGQWLDSPFTNISSLTTISGETLPLSLAANRQWSVVRLSLYTQQLIDNGQW